MAAPLLSPTPSSSSHSHSHTRSRSPHRTSPAAQPPKLQPRRPAYFEQYPERSPVLSSRPSTSSGPLLAEVRRRTFSERQQLQRPRTASGSGSPPPSPSFASFIPPALSLAPPPPNPNPRDSIIVSRHSPRLSVLADPPPTPPWSPVTGEGAGPEPDPSKTEPTSTLDMDALVADVNGDQQTRLKRKSQRDIRARAAAANGQVYPPPLPTGPPAARAARRRSSASRPSTSTISTTASAALPRTPPLHPVNPSSPQRGVSSPPKMQIPSIDDIVRKHGPALKVAPSVLANHQQRSPAMLIPSIDDIVRTHKPALGPQRPAGRDELEEEREDEGPVWRASIDSVEEEIRQTLRLGLALEDKTELDDRESGSLRTSRPGSSSDRRLAFMSVPGTHTSASSPTTVSSSTLNPPQAATLSPTLSSSPTPPPAAPSTALAVAQYLRSPRLTRLLKLSRPPNAHLTVSFADVGSPTGDPVLVFLGLGCVRYLVALYDEMAEALGLRLICIDRWGLGRTDDVPAAQRGLLEWAGVVEEVLDQLDIDKVSILAHSAGAPYALATALRIPERVHGSIRLLAPWVPTAGVDGAGWKWLKHVPAGVIKAAQAAEWRMQGWALGKPPELKYEGIGYDPKAPVSSPERECPAVGLGLAAVSNAAAEENDDDAASYDDLADFGGRYSSSSLTRPVELSPPPAPPPPAPPAPAPAAMKKKQSKSFLGGLFRSPKSSTASSSSSSTPSPSPPPPPPPVPQLPRSASHGAAHTRAARLPSSGSLPSLSSAASLSLSLGPLPQIRTDSLDALAPLPTRDRKPSSSHAYVHAARSTSSRSRSSTRSTSRPTTPILTPTSPQPSISTAPASPSKPVDLGTALLAASHAESLKGGTADLLAILDRGARPWGFDYTQVERDVRVWWGDRDERIAREGVRWMERCMRRCSLKVLPGKGHGLMTEPSVLVEALEEMAEEWKKAGKRW